MIQTSAAHASLPFEPQLSPEQAFQHDGWRQARSAVLKALAEGQLALLVGQSGAGKTLLLRELERTLDAAGVAARRDGPDSAAEPVAPDIVRLVDEADVLDDATLQRLTRTGKATVLAVLPRSVERMTRLPGPVAPTPLAPLSRVEVDDFVAAALGAAGRPADTFSAEAVAALAHFSEGLPGQLNRLGQASLLHAQLEEVPRVQPEHVSRAAEILRAGTASPRPPAAPRAEPLSSSELDDPRAPMAVAEREAAGPWWRRPTLLILSGLCLAVVLAVLMIGWLLPERSLHVPGEEHAAARSNAGGTMLPAEDYRRRTAAANRQGPEAPPPALQPAAPAAAGGRPTTGSEGRAAEAPPRAASAERPMRGVADAPASASVAVAPDPADRTPAPNADGAVPGQPIDLPPRRAAPEPDGAVAAATFGSFRGTTFNETLGRGGGLQLVVTRVGPGDAAAVRFEASRGLVGTGQLAGRVSPDGRLVASGILMMGSNPFNTELEGTVSGKQLVGTVRYSRVVEPGGRTSSTRGSFRLVRE